MKNNVAALATMTTLAPQGRSHASEMTIRHGCSCAARVAARVASRRAAAPTPSPLVRQTRHRLGKRSAAHRQRPHRRDGVRRHRLRAPADLREIPVDRRARFRRRLRLRSARGLAGRAHALASANNSPTARSSSPKTWPNNSAARCTTTATTRASAISSSNVSPTRTPVTDYRRELDLDTAIARVSFKQGGVGFRREYFVSYPDQVLVARWYGTSVQKLRVRFAVPDNRSAAGAMSDAQGLTVSGALKSNGLKYAADLRVIPECGTVTRDGDSLRIETECAITFVARRAHQLPHAVSRLSRGRRRSGAEVATAEAAAVGKGHARMTRRATRATTRRCSGAWSSISAAVAPKKCPPTSCARSTAAATRRRIARSSSSTSSTAATC